MNRITSVICIVLALSLIAGIMVTADEAAAPNIVGTWVLVSREMPDGTVLKAPDVGGMMTFTATKRNFNVFWKDAEGKVVSFSCASSYTLSAEEYTESSVFYCNNLAGNGYEAKMEPVSGSAPVTVKDGTYSWDFPLLMEPPVSLSGDKMTASMPNQFVDHWERVK